MTATEIAMLIGAFFSGLGALAAVVIPLYFKERRGAEALSSAIDEAKSNGGDAQSTIAARTETDLNLKKHLDGVRKRTATKRLRSDQV